MYAFAMLLDSNFLIYRGIHAIFSFGPISVGNHGFFTQSTIVVLEKTSQQTVRCSFCGEVHTLFLQQAQSEAEGELIGISVASLLSV